MLHIAYCFKQLNKYNYHSVLLLNISTVYILYSIALLIVMYVTNPYNCIANYSALSYE